MVPTISTTQQAFPVQGQHPTGERDLEGGNKKILKHKLAKRSMRKIISLNITTYNLTVSADICVNRMECPQNLIYEPRYQDKLEPSSFHSCLSFEALGN